jgi:phosphoribosylformylglycinamidine synthase
MLRIDEETGLGIALADANNPRFCLLNPYLGAQLALSESYRNVAVTGAQPVAITDCLNFGSPEDPDVMWQFIEAIMGLVDGCRELGNAGHRRQRQFLQPDRRGEHPPDAGRRHAGGHR